MKKALTALQPTGFLHLGNYFGAIEPIVNLQKNHQIFMFVVDYHAITIPQNPSELKENILFATATYLAAGINPEQTILFQQSLVHQHTELTWILNCLAKVSELERMTQFKDKAKNKGQSVSMGLFDYPVLMASDILLYDTELVPVGADQKQHVELARTLAKRFNHQFGQTFTIPEPMIRKEGARIMSLIDPTKKMSKSSNHPKSYISLMDKPATVEKKIKGAITDSDGQIKFDLDHPALSNLLTIYSLVSQTKISDLEKKYQDHGYADFKKDLAQAINIFLAPLQEKINQNMKNQNQLIDLLQKGAIKAEKIAQKKLTEVQKKIGLYLEKQN